MNSYNYQTTLKRVWEDALDKYRSGLREPEEYFDAGTLGKLAALGLRVMDVYDYVEDYDTRGEPDFETFLMICEARRDYFLTEQKGKPSDNRLDSSTLPAKTD
ncbi:MAG TPA: hypothetical protein VJ952_12725, partial [Opitutales bacterium]|nr:hypothetical protein [Opitutales bacterium]